MGTNAEKCLIWNAKLDSRSSQKGWLKLICTTSQHPIGRSVGQTETVDKLSRWLRTQKAADCWLRCVPRTCGQSYGYSCGQLANQASLPTNWPANQRVIHTHTLSLNKCPVHAYFVYTWVVIRLWVSRSDRQANYRTMESTLVYVRVCVCVGFACHQAWETNRKWKR